MFRKRILKKVQCSVYEKGKERKGGKHFYTFGKLSRSVEVVDVVDSGGVQSGSILSSAK